MIFFSISKKTHSESSVYYIHFIRKCFDKTCKNIKTLITIFFLMLYETIKFNSKNELLFLI